MIRVVSVQVGLPRTLQVGDLKSQSGQVGSFESGIVKESVVGRIQLGRLNLAGDGQADLKNHGGADKAVLGYASTHYSAWVAELGRELSYGSFGENFSIENLTEDTVCLGDMYAIGEAIVEVSQPREPCWKLSRRWQIPDLEARVRTSGRTGWYFRVLSEGMVGAGDFLHLLKRPCPEWTVAKASSVLNDKTCDRALVAEVAACPYLSKDWRQVLQKRLHDALEGRG